MNYIPALLLGAGAGMVIGSAMLVAIIRYVLLPRLGMPGYGRTLR